MKLHDSYFEALLIISLSILGMYFTILSYIITPMLSNPIAKSTDVCYSHSGLRSTDISRAVPARSW
jgi:hypothetical protein